MQGIHTVMPSVGVPRTVKREPVMCGWTKRKDDDPSSGLQVVKDRAGMGW
jgi:hypothetical protein